MSEFGAGQTLSGRVLRTMVRRSPQVVGESFRFVHDPGPLDRWLYDELGERIVAVYEIDRQPRVGPIHMYDRSIVSGLGVEEARKQFFAGNQWLTLFGNPRTFPPEFNQVRVPRRTADESYLNDLARAQELNRVAPSAPREQFDGDVLWSLDPALDWFSVRSFARASDGVDHERLSLVALPNALLEGSYLDWVEETDAFVRDEAASLGRELIACEVMQSTLQLNNASVFVIERRTRLSDEEYVERYIR